MLKKIAHIGIAVEKLETALKIYRDTLGMKFGEISEFPPQKVKIAFLEIDGVKIELLEATSQESAIAKFIEKKGAGIHHIAFEVSDIEKTIEELKVKNFSLIDEKPREGAHNTKVAFLHPKSTGGVLIELVEKI
ncbi:MAG: methylmalonyl-CoA epimerase [Elusimicrobiota bacterium]|nr:methylmalonyl-CoA epimerase [Elusimicrobiota bacterium]